MKPVYIPKTKLATQLAETVQIKQEMTQILLELERTATGRPVKKAGTWRHHPADYPKST